MRRLQKTPPLLDLFSVGLPLIKLAQESPQKARADATPSAWFDAEVKRTY
jgi:hypothetical protein